MSSKLDLYFWMCFLAPMVHAKVLHDDDGRNSAFEFCESFSFDLERDECRNWVRTSQYFHQAAIQACRSLSFQSEKMSCLKAITNKEYAYRELQLCKSRHFTREQIDCLDEFGNVVGDFLPLSLTKAKLTQKLSEAKVLIERGRDQEAARELENLLQTLAPHSL